MIYGIPAFAQTARGLSLINSALVVLPYGAATTIFVFVSIVLSKWISIRVSACYATRLLTLKAYCITKSIILIGTGIWALGVGLFVRLDANTPISIIFAISSTAGIGCGG